METRRQSLTARLRNSGLVGSVCAIAVLLAMLGEFAGAAMEDGAAHVVCPEHGELTHVVQAMQSSSHARDGSDRPQGAVAESAATPEGHEHCPFFAVLNQPTPTLKVELFLIATQDAGEPVPPPAGSARPALQQPLLAAAPKTSPPQA